MEESSPKEKLSNNELFNTLILKEKVLFILYDYVDLAKKEIAQVLLPITSVTSVTFVTQNGNTGNKSDTGNKVTSLNNSLKVILKREIDIYKTIKVNRSDKPYSYSLTEKGRTFVLSKWEEFKKNLNEATKRSGRTSFNETTVII